MPRRNRVVLAVAVVAVVGIAARVALPHAVKDYVNRGLQRLETYEGRVDDVDLALWRGAYGIDGIRIIKRGKRNQTPFFSSDRLDLSIEWRSLLRGALVSEGEFLGPNLNLIQEKSERESQLGTEEDWRASLEELFPFRFNTIRILDGTVTFRAPGIRAEEALKAERVNGAFTNLTNVADDNEETFADFRLDASVLGDAPATVHGSVAPWNREPTFDVDLQITGVELPKVNPWLREYIKADAASGEFELYLEIAAAGNRFKGYAKPILREVDIISSADSEDSLPRKLWEGIIDFAAEVFENKEQDQVAARTPFSGSIDNPQAGVWATLVSVVRNAFVSAFARSLEGSISIRDVKKNLEPLSEGDNDAAGASANENPDR